MNKAASPKGVVTDKNSTQGRSVLISGCSSGIGKCVAQGLHPRGYRVFASVRDPSDGAVFHQVEEELTPCFPCSTEEKKEIHDASRLRAYEICLIPADTPALAGISFEPCDITYFDMN